jgi:glycosyltransferase involved in cell wall biosynthesis
MWEWLSPGDDWLRYVDLLICPTHHAYRLFTDWKRRFGFRWHVVYFPWPISTGRFRFRPRENCCRFVFINGHGGACARQIETDRPLGLRKGLDLVLATAALTPQIAWTVYTQSNILTRVPPNVDVRWGPADHAQLYEEGDVCVQPSRWEGLGLQLLECQAAGMPLITIDAPPMDEHHPFCCVKPSDWQWGYVAQGQPIPIPMLDPKALAKIACDLHGRDIRAASLAVHEWVRRERSWDQGVHAWRSLFETVSAAKAG